jgi:site-specific DNA-methyltransferase (adenine-specific)
MRTVEAENFKARKVVSETRVDMFGEYEVQDIRKMRVGMAIPLQISAQHQVAITAPSTDLAKQWHGWGTALKPAYEPAILARKPLRGTVADNVAQWGTGGLNIDGCRVEAIKGDYNHTGNNNHTHNHKQYSGYRNEGKQYPPNSGGRWPANVILDEEAAAALDEQVGGASRFFYTAKASRSEREAGLDGVEKIKLDIGDERTSGGSWERRDDRTSAQRANHHPTVKPIALMRYIIRLVAPRGAVVLDPFMGSGSTGCAAMVEGVQFVGIDITPEYVDIARRRLAWWSCSLDGNAIMETEEDEA